MTEPRIASIPSLSSGTAAIDNWAQTVKSWIDARNGTRDSSEAVVTQKQLKDYVNRAAPGRQAQPGDLIIDIGGGVTASVAKADILAIVGNTASTSSSTASTSSSSTAVTALDAKLQLEIDALTKGLNSVTGTASDNAIAISLLNSKKSTRTPLNVGGGDAPYGSDLTSIANVVIYFNLRGSTSGYVGATSYLVLGDTVTFTLVDGSGRWGLVRLQWTGKTWAPLKTPTDADYSTDVLNYGPILHPASLLQNDVSHLKYNEFGLLPYGIVTNVKIPYTFQGERNMTIVGGYKDPTYGFRAFVHEYLTIGKDGRAVLWTGVPNAQPIANPTLAQVIHEFDFTTVNTQAYNILQNILLVNSVITGASTVSGNTVVAGTGKTLAQIANNVGTSRAPITYAYGQVPFSINGAVFNTFDDSVASWCVLYQMYGSAPAWVYPMPTVWLVPGDRCRIYNPAGGYDATKQWTGSAWA